MRTSSAYQNVLGGSNELTPYSLKKQEPVLSQEIKLDQPFNYSQKDYGLAINFDSLGFQSNRVQVKISCTRKELETNSSYDALLCLVLEDGITRETKSFSSFRLNEAPSSVCCETKEYNYSSNISAEFKPNDKFSVFLWNKKVKAFLVNKFSVQVYNYKFQLN